MVCLGRRRRRRSPAARPAVRTGDDSQRDRLGRRPCPWPVGGRDREPHAVSRRQHVPDRVELDHHLLGLPRHQRRWTLIRFKVAEVQDLPRDQLGGAVREHLAEAHADQRQRPVGRERQRHLREAQHVQVAFQRRRVERQRHAVVGALVVGVVGRRALATPCPAVEAAGLTPEDPVLGLLAGLASSVLAQPQRRGSATGGGHAPRSTVPAARGGSAPAAPSPSPTHAASARP